VEPSVVLSVLYLTAAASASKVALALSILLWSRLTEAPLASNAPALSSIETTVPAYAL